MASDASVNETLLKAEKVAGGYRKDYDILKEVDMEVRAGEVVCLIGPNGAGKSTLLKAVCGSLPYVNGTIAFRGENIVGLKPHQTLQKGISYVPQGRRVFLGMSILENLDMGGYTITDRDLLHQRKEKVLNLFPVLREKRDQLAYKLSGGEQQMLAIARALILEPCLLMLDEPSLGLAPKVASLVFEKIQELNALGMTILLVEQQAKRGLRIANRGYVLVLGRTMLTDTAQNLLTDQQVRDLYIGA